MKLSLASAGVAALLTIAALLLGQNASDLSVPGARYVAAASHGFDALATAGAKPAADPTAPTDGAVPTDAEPDPAGSPSRSKV